jgi:hypothetical protein
MKVLMNRRISMRRRQKRSGPKPRTILTRLRARTDQSMVLDLPWLARQSLGKGVGGRVWFYVKDKGLHITVHPWGPQAGRHGSTRIRTTHVSIRRSKRRGVDPPLMCNGRQSRRILEWTATGSSSLKQQFRRLVDQLAGFAVQCASDLENHDQIGQVFTALDLAHVRAFDLGQVGQFFLSQTQLEPPLAHDLAKSDGRCRFERGGTAGTAWLDFTRLHSCSFALGHHLDHVIFNS